MKTKRRHELQTNVLADWMGKQIEALRPHSQTIAIGAIAAVAVVVGLIALSQYLGSKSAVGWPEYFSAFAERNPEKLVEVADTAGVDDRAANWALLTAAELQASEGALKLYEDHDTGAKILEEAKDKLEQLAERAPTDPYLKQRSQFVAGQVYESLAAARSTGAVGNLDKARDHYEAAKEVDSGSPLGKAAADALIRLKDEAATKELVEAFAEHEPPARAAGSGLPPLGSGPINADDPILTERDLPLPPNLTVPGLGGGTGAGAGAVGEGETSEPAETTPAETTPAETTPSETTPTETTPSAETETTPPSDETPASDAPASDASSEADPAAPASGEPSQP